MNVGCLDARRTSKEDKNPEIRNVLALDPAMDSGGGMISVRVYRQSSVQTLVGPLTRTSSEFCRKRKSQNGSPWGGGHSSQTDLGTPRATRDMNLLEPKSNEKYSVLSHCIAGPCHRFHKTLDIEGTLGREPR